MLAAALLLLNASLTFGNVWPTPKIRWEPSVSVELAVCVLLLAVAHHRADHLARRAAAACVDGGWLGVAGPHPG